MKKNRGFWYINHNNILILVDHNFNIVSKIDASTINIGVEHDKMEL